MAPFVPYNDVLARIAMLKLRRVRIRIRDRVQAEQEATFDWDKSLVDTVLTRDAGADSGRARSTTFGAARCYWSSPRQ